MKSNKINRISGTEFFHLWSPASNSHQSVFCSRRVQDTLIEPACCHQLLQFQHLTIPVQQEKHWKWLEQLLMQRWELLHQQQQESWLKKFERYWKYINFWTSSTIVFALGEWIDLPEAVWYIWVQWGKKISWPHLGWVLTVSTIHIEKTGQVVCGITVDVCSWMFCSDIPDGTSEHWMIQTTNF